MRLWKSAKQLLRGFHIRNIQTLISFSSIIVTVLTVVLVSTLLYNRFTRAAEKNVELSLEEIVEQVNSNLELYVSGMQDVFELTEHKIASTPEAASDERLGNELGTVLNTREDLVSIALFTEEGKLVRNVPEIPMRQIRGFRSSCGSNPRWRTRASCSLRRPIFKTCLNGSTVGSCR
ncbi:hypothetical protein HMSSN036_85230 [Paenibacillus macerans]|nr:hypothetical protein HMSSN036_85230 [Paenibacillus macerans]